MQGFVCLFENELRDGIFLEMEQAATDESDHPRDSFHLSVSLNPTLRVTAMGRARASNSPLGTIRRTSAMTHTRVLLGEPISDSTNS